MDVQIALQELAQGFSTAAIGKEFFRTLAQYISKALAVDYVFIGELTQENQNVRSVVFFSHGKIVDNLEYPLVGTLCESVVKPQFCAFTQNVQQQFPKNKALQWFGVDSYVGTPLFNSAGKVLGLIYVMHSGPITDLAQTESLLTIAARRAELELEREQQARELHQANQRLHLELAERLRAESQLRQANQELLRTQAQLRDLNEQLEQRVAKRTGELQLANEQISQLLEREKIARTDAQIQQKRIETLLIQAPVAIGIFTGPDYRIELANEAICNIWGRTQAEVVGKPLFQALPELKGQVFEEMMQAVFTTGQTYVGNEIVGQITRGGHQHQAYVNLVYQAIRNSDGAVTGMMVVANEVTDQVLARKKVEESEAKVWRVLDNIPEITWVTDGKGRYRYANRQWSEYTGIANQSDQKSILKQAIHPEDYEKSRLAWVEAVNTGKPYQIEQRLRRYDGEYRWMLGRALPLYDETGNILEWVGTTTDIHDQKQATQFLYTLLESIPHLAWTSNSKQPSISFFNKRWYDYTGLSQDDSLGFNWQQALHPDDLPKVIQTIQENRQAELPYEIENRYRRASDGMYRWHLSRVVPIFDKPNNVTMWVGTATDIHDHKMVQHTLERTLQELHVKNFELDQFVYKTSHDLRSPLSTILGLVELLKMEPEESMKTQYVDHIEGRVHKLDAFIRSMLDYSRNVRTKSEYKKVDFLNIIQECLAQLEYMKHYERLRICYEIGEGSFYSDLFRLKIIFSNLISNAIKYQAFNKEQSTLNIFIDVDSRQATIRCVDNGVGIDQAYQEQIFNMFFRASESAEGSGLGLYIVKQAVGVLEGSIRMESKPGVGTQFVIELPNQKPAS